MILALILFAATYVLLMVLPKWRALIAVLSAVLFVVLGILPLDKVFFAVNWNVILMIAGTMGSVYLFIESKMPVLLADHIIDKMPDEKWAIISLALFAGIISAFVDNVATVLMVAPVALSVSKKLGMSPVPGIIAIAVSSNLQGAATLVGDTTSILLGGYAGMNFADFFFFRGRFSMFWVVEAGALASAFIMLWLFRKNNKPIRMEEKTKVDDYFPTVLLVGTVILLILASFFPDPPKLINGMICTGVFLLGLLRDLMRRRDRKVITKVLTEIDWFTLALLAGLFVVIAGITEAGVVDEISRLFVRFSGNNVFLIYTLITWSSVLLSAFIDNIPYVATMLPVVSGIGSLLQVDPTVLYFGLLCGATLGGNLTPIGASANIAGLGILSKSGYEVKAKEFMHISIPFTLSAVGAGYLLIWLIWRP